MGERLLRTKQVLEKLAISRTTLWRGAKDGTLPAGFKLTKNTHVWPEREIDAVINRGNAK